MGGGGSKAAVVAVQPRPSAPTDQKLAVDVAQSIEAFDRIGARMARLEGKAAAREEGTRNRARNTFAAARAFADAHELDPRVMGQLGRVLERGTAPETPVGSGGKESSIAPVSWAAAGAGRPKSDDPEIPAPRQQRKNREREEAHLARIRRARDKAKPQPLPSVEKLKLGPEMARKQREREAAYLQRQLAVQELKKATQKAPKLPAAEGWSLENEAEMQARSAARASRQKQAKARQLNMVSSKLISTEEAAQKADALREASAARQQAALERRAAVSFCCSIFAPTFAPHLLYFASGTFTPVYSLKCDSNVTVLHCI